MPIIGRVCNTCFALTTFLLSACVSSGGLVIPSEQDSCSISIAKWQSDRPSAVSMTFDHAWGYADVGEMWLRRVIADSVLPADFDYTSSYIYEVRQQRCAADTLQRLGISFFAHGHLHVNTDAMSYVEALANFRQCQDSMRSLGMKPLLYAYPGGYGYNPSTRKAAEDAGFLAARMFAPLESPYILAEGGATIDWYRLPTLTMFSRAFQAHSPLLQKGTTITHDTEELKPFLSENVRRGSWLILTYHAIGRNDEENSYEMHDFLTDITAVRAHDCWFARMRDVTLYTREREVAKMTLECRRDTNGRLEQVLVRLEDGLPDDVYDVPLTVVVTPLLAWQGKKLRAFPQDNPNAAQTLVPCRAASWRFTVLPNGKTYILTAE